MIENMFDISIIVPCRNEEKDIIIFLESILKQNTNYKFEVVIADGQSNDRTRVLIDEFKNHYPLNIKLVDNHKKTIPSGLNIAVKNSIGRFIVRLDAHSIVDENYIDSLVTQIEKNYDIAGPSICYIPSSKSMTALVIVSILNSFLGNGGTPSRNKLSSPRTVSHAVMSSYKREVFDAIGGYNEDLLSNEDFEFDYRATKNGFKVTALPSPKYFAYARNTIFHFWKQRFRYGFWKTQVIRLHPKSVHLRQLIPPIFFLFFLFFLFILPKISIFLAIMYFILMLLSFIRDKNRFSWIFLYTVLMFVNHLAWTLGLFYGIFYSKKH